MVELTPFHHAFVQEHVTQERRLIFVARRIGALVEVAHVPELVAVSEDATRAIEPVKLATPNRVEVSPHYHRAIKRQHLFATLSDGLENLLVGRPHLPTLAP